MIARSLALAVLALALVACPTDGDKPDDSHTDSSGASTGGASTGGVTTSGSTGPTTGEPPGDATCPVRPYGEWAACEQGGIVDNSACKWMDSGKSGAVTCLSPQSGGGFNVCGIEGCVDDCDCFSPPATGDAVVYCAPILGDGGKACALYCAGGQTCPDGMTCQGGYCFWSE